MNPRPLALALALFAVLSPAGTGRAAPLAKSPGASTEVPGELLVQFKPRASARAAAAAISAKGHTSLRTLTPRGLKHVKAAPGQSVSAAMAQYATDPDVEYVQPNYVYRAAAVPNDLAFGQLWGFRNTGQTITYGSYPNNPGTAGADARVERAWDVLTDCSSVVVAVLDSGVQYSHEDLSANMWSGGTAYPRHGWDFVDLDDDPMDLNGHGTHVAGTIGAVGNNGRGVAGVCWKARIMAVRVLDHAGIGSTAGIIEGIQFAVERGARIINMSLGGAGGFDSALSAAITAAQQADVAVIVAAGNEGTNVDGGTRTYPCAFTHPNLLCVAALDQTDQLASFSNHGSASVDVGAPGTNIRSTWHASSTTVTDPLNSGWFVSSTTTGAGWFYSVYGTYDVLANPGSFPDGLYRHSTDDRIYKSFDLTGAAVASLELGVLARVAPGDRVRVACSNSTTDPFAGTGVTLLDDVDGAVEDGEFFSLDLTGCAGGLASIGFRLTTDASIADQGLAIGHFKITTEHLSTTRYGMQNGTSMATPLVAGVAALLRARNPLYTAADVVDALKAAGRPVPTLAGKTTTGRAVDAMGTLAHIRPPTGLTATIQ